MHWSWDHTSDPPVLWVNVADSYSNKSEGYQDFSDVQGLFDERQDSPSKGEILQYLQYIQTSKDFSLLDLQHLCGEVWPPLSLGGNVYWEKEL